MFEYPSEASLLDDHGSFDMEDERGLSSGANSPGLPNPFRKYGFCAVCCIKLMAVACKMHGAKLSTLDRLPKGG